MMNLPIRTLQLHYGVWLTRSWSCSYLPCSIIVSGKKKSFASLNSKSEFVISSHHKHNLLYRHRQYQQHLNSTFSVKLSDGMSSKISSCADRCNLHEIVAARPALALGVLMGGINQSIT